MNSSPAYAMKAIRVSRKDRNSNIFRPYSVRSRKVGAGYAIQFVGRAAATPAQLKVPNRLANLSRVEAALAYANAGWYVLPTAPSDNKNPGSVVGNGWHRKSSRSTRQIRQWWANYPDRGIALHMEKSRALAFDLDIDDLESVPHEYRDALRSGLFQSGRNSGDRGHYVFALDAADSFGNGAGAFRAFGEVRCKGVIICEPTLHQKAESENARYRWVAPGVVPPLPGVLRRCLRSGVVTDVEPLAPQQLTEFLDTYCDSDRPGALNGVLKVFAAEVNGGMSRHEAMVNALCMAFREAVAGCYSAHDAYEQVSVAFNESFGGAGVQKERRSQPAPGELHKTAMWAAAQALNTDVDKTLARLDRDMPGGAQIDEEGFWASRESLTRLRQFARARRVGPWSMLGVVMARVCAAVPPSVVLPPTVGGHASLNLFVALVGASGEGKGSSESAAEDAVETTPGVYVSTPGSGEGIPKQYAHKSAGRQVNLRNSVMFSVGEIDTLAALGNRSNSTLMPELRKAWMGERMGFGYADPTKAIPIMGHRYRMAMVVGVQPGRSRALLDDSDGGTPQRFIWLPTKDADAPDIAPQEPESCVLARWPRGVLVTMESAVSTVSEPSDDGGNAIRFQMETLALEENPDRREFQVLEIPSEAEELIHATQLAKLRGDNQGSGLEGHALLARLKVAAALMALDGRTDAVQSADWELAGVVMAMSDRTRGETMRGLAQQARDDNVSRGRARGVQDVAAEDIADEERMARASKLIRQHLKDSSPMTRKLGRSKLRRELRDYYDEAVDRLKAAGVVQVSGGSQGSYSVSLCE